MKKKPAQYLLRFDDLCPTMDRLCWARMAELIEEFELKPILAVVPANQDPELMAAPLDPAFWHEMRRLQSLGASIALHGYRHICASPGGSLIALHRMTEFAGVEHALQRTWIREGSKILRSEGLEPTLFVAPRHGFDQATLRALREEGITIISDGFARRPFRRAGLIWVPQQLWGPASRSHGLWTICIHANHTHAADAAALRRFLLAHRSQFSSLRELLEQAPIRPLNLSERVCELAAQARVVGRGKWRELRHAAHAKHMT